MCDSLDREVLETMIFLSFFSFHSLFATGSCDGTACIWRYHHSQWKTCSVSVPVEENR